MQRQVPWLAAGGRGDVPLPLRCGLPAPHGGRLLPWRGLLLRRGARLLPRRTAPSVLGVRGLHAGAALRCGGFLQAPFDAWRVPPGSRAGRCWWSGRLGPRHLGGHRHRCAPARRPRGPQAGVPWARGLNLAPGAQWQPGPAAARPLRPPLARQRRAQARAPRRQARLLPGASLPLALPPTGSAREGALRGLARARQAPWRRVPALVWQKVPPGPGQGRARREHRFRDVPGLAPPRVSSQPRPARSWIGHG
jgi:hypothetical protein